jgi:aspartate/methionine/tyrosine aminotransferase
VLIELMKMCERHKIHLVSDEIYALSTFENRVDGAAAQADSTSDFVSVLEIGTAGIMDPSLLHVLWGMSKDFGANGLRLGVIISQSNPAFIMACRTCSLYSYPSALTENAVTAMLTDTQFVERYIRENQKRLADAHALAVEALRKYEIPYTPGVNAGFFLWVNLGKKYLEKHPEEKVQGEGDPHAITGIIFKKLMQTRVFVVDGEAAGAEEPGWFRLVFTQPRDMVEEGIKRIAEAVA